MSRREIARREQSVLESVSRKTILVHEPKYVSLRALRVFPPLSYWRNAQDQGGSYQVCGNARVHL